MPDVAVVIPAGGTGQRMGGALPKQFLRLGGMTILERSIRAFHGLRAIGEIVLVVPGPYVEKTRRLVARAGFRKVRSVVAGGKERQDSVRLGLAACSPETGTVLVHDAVRPLVTRKVILAVLREARQHRAAVVGIRVKDTIKMESAENPGYYDRTVPREGLWAVQTPQGFAYPLLQEAQRQALESGFTGTDEASLVERLGRPVRIVEGSESNLKITTPADLKLAGFLLRGK
jgi:2-C-methyl-D-erythritol 4-phosphate cytidylyltransferase